MRESCFSKRDKNAYLPIPNEGKSMFTVLMCGEVDVSFLCFLLVCNLKKHLQHWGKIIAQKVHFVLAALVVTVLIKQVDTKSCKKLGILLIDGHEYLT